MPITANRSNVSTDSIGEAWLTVAQRILDEGVPASWDGLPMREIRNVTIDAAHPDPRDPLILRYADPERLAWMHANFTDHTRVRELGDAASYASRIFDYGRTGLDQLSWAIERLRADPLARNATITTFEPLTDTTYIPCVSLLDFWIPDGALELVVYCHGIDFGSKGYGNLVELADLQHRVADALGLAVGTLSMVVKTAHVYDTEVDYMRGVLAQE